MRKIGMLCFTRAGCETMLRLREGLLKLGYEVSAYIKTEYAAGVEQKPNPAVTRILYPAAQWTREQFGQADGLIYIGAAGIAVRLIAPCIQDKMLDPAVVVVDEGGAFAVSLLSGHLGGANELTAITAGLISAVPVITTATDRRQLFAVDLFAKKNNLLISDRAAARDLSAALLAGERAGFYSEFPVSGVCPPELVDLGKAPEDVQEEAQKEAEQSLRHGVAVSVHTGPRYFKPAGGLLLIPRAVVLGIGCRKGVPEAAVSSAVTEFLTENHIEARAVARMASIDRKKEEPALLGFCEKRNLKLLTFTAEELSRAAGQFSESEFVKSVTGVPNVCERAAVCGCEGTGRLLVQKQVYDKVTVAAAIEEPVLYF